MTIEMTDAELTQCYLYEREHKPANTIARDLHRSYSTVVDWLRELGIYRGFSRTHHFTPQQENILWTYGKQGVTAHSLAGQLGVSDGTVVRWLTDMGIYKGRHITKQVTEAHKKPRCEVCEILLAEAKKMDGSGNDTTCLDCLQKRAPGYIIDIPELVLVEMEG